MELWWTLYCKYFSILLTDAMIKKNYSFCVFRCIGILTQGVVRGTFLDRSPLRCRNVVAEGGCRLEWARCPDEQSAPDAWTERTQSRVDVCGFTVPGSEPAVPAVLRLQIRSPGRLHGLVTRTTAVLALRPGRSQVLLDVCGHSACDVVADASALFALAEWALSRVDFKHHTFCCNFKYLFISG